MPVWHFRSHARPIGRRLFAAVAINRGAMPTLERDYENAVRIIDSRRRVFRPKHSDRITSQTRTTKHATVKSSGTPGLKGAPSISGMSEWLLSLGHSSADIDRLNLVHIAGTKGKGSTCAFTASILRAHGRRTGFPARVGLYTSPHLMVPEERIRINGTPISQQLFAQYFFELFDRLPQLALEYDPTKTVVERGPRYLQLFALLAIHTFIREKVDVVVLETHSGGEYDATNVIDKPHVTAITSLGMDHVEMLGPTIENIAWHKAGIFKNGATALSAEQDVLPRKVLESRSADKGCAIRFVGADSRLPHRANSLKVKVQRQNASLAVAISETVLQRCAPSMPELSKEDIVGGVTEFSWPGRFQIVSRGRHTWYLDAAHNEMSVNVAAQWYQQAVQEQELRCTSDESRDVKEHEPEGSTGILIFSHINELRDSAALLRHLANALEANGACIEHVIFSTYDESDDQRSTETTAMTDDFVDIWRRVYPETSTWKEPTIQGAMELAKKLGTDILITGSQHLVGPALRILKYNPTVSGI